MGNLARVKQLVRRVRRACAGRSRRITIPATTTRRAESTTLQWGAPTRSRCLDTALAWAVINRHFDVADFLLEHGADINTNWNSHEPASILHHLVFHAEPYESMQFLIDRGIDMTIKDYRWNSNAAGLGALRAKRREDGPVAGGGGTAAGTRDDEHLRERVPDLQASVPLSPPSPTSSVFLVAYSSDLMDIS